MNSGNSVSLRKTYIRVSLQMARNVFGVISLEHNVDIVTRVYGDRGYVGYDIDLLEDRDKPTLIKLLKDVKN